MTTTTKFVDKLIEDNDRMLAALEVALKRLYEIEETEDLDCSTTSDMYEQIEDAIAKAKQPSR